MRVERTFGSFKEIKRKNLKKDSIRAPGVMPKGKYKTLKYGHPYSRKTATQYDTASPTKQPVNGGIIAVLHRGHYRLGNGNGLREFGHRVDASDLWDRNKRLLEGGKSDRCEEGSGRGAGRLDENRVSILRASFTAKAVPLIEIEWL